MWLLVVVSLLSAPWSPVVRASQSVHTEGRAHNRDDILEINRYLIPENDPDSSFLMEGDIIKNRSKSTYTRNVLKWFKINGEVIIPYVLSGSYEPPEKKIIMDAFSALQASTCLRFVEHTNETDYISIQPVFGCFSSVGRLGKMQLVSLDFVCLRSDRGKGVALHELMHVAGFWHEHSRADRDDYVRIIFNQIMKGYERNFCKYETSNMIVKYDLESILHYSRYAFSKSGFPTIIQKDNFTDAQIGQRLRLSPSDILRVNKFYSCPQYKASMDDDVLQESPHLIFSCNKADFSDNSSGPEVNSQMSLPPPAGASLLPSTGTSLSSSFHESALAPSPGAALAPSPGAALAPSPGAALAPSPGAALAPSPGAALAPSPGAALAPSPGAALAPSPGAALAPSLPRSTHKSMLAQSSSHTFTSKQSVAAYALTPEQTPAWDAINLATALSAGASLPSSTHEGLLSQSFSHTFTSKQTAAAYALTPEQTPAWEAINIATAHSAGAGLAPSAGAGLAPSAGAGLAPSAGAGLAPSPGAGLAPSPGAGLAPSPGAGLAPSPGAGLAPSPGAGLAPSPGASLPSSTHESMLSQSSSHTFTSKQTAAAYALTPEQTPAWEAINLATALSASAALAPSTGSSLPRSTHKSMLGQSSSDTFTSKQTVAAYALTPEQTPAWDAINLATALSAGAVPAPSADASLPSSTHEGMLSQSFSHTFTSKQTAADYALTPEQTPAWAAINIATAPSAGAALAPSAGAALAPSAGASLLRSTHESMLSHFSSHTFTSKSAAGYASTPEQKPAKEARSLATPYASTSEQRPTEESWTPAKSNTFSSLPGSTLKYMLSLASTKILRSMTTATSPRTVTLGITEKRNTGPSNVLTDYLLTARSKIVTNVDVESSQVPTKHITSQPLLTAVQESQHFYSTSSITTGNMDAVTVITSGTKPVTLIGSLTRALPSTSVFVQRTEKSGPKVKPQISTSNDGSPGKHTTLPISKSIGTEDHRLSWKGAGGYSDLFENWSSGQLQGVRDDKSDANLNPEYIKLVGKRSLSEHVNASKSIVMKYFRNVPIPKEENANPLNEKRSKTAQLPSAKRQSVHLVRWRESSINRDTKFTRILLDSPMLYNISKIFTQKAYSVTTPWFLPLRNAVSTELPSLCFGLEMYPQEVCKFDKGLCGWTQSMADDLDWRLTQVKQISSSKYHILLDKPEGVHLSVDLERGSIPGQKALLLSPILKASNCISFWFSFQPHIKGKLNLYVKPAILWGQWRLLWSAGGHQRTRWTKTQITLTPPYLHRSIQVAVEGIVGPSAENGVVIDNLYVGQCR